MWGQAATFTQITGKEGIIPTRVGTSYKNDIDKAFGEDHPHACGDKTFQIAQFTAEEGSSPRVWGQGDITLPSHSGHRIIPTRVGTRVFAYTNFLACKDHPHACGDKKGQEEKQMAKIGSSPRVWGQVSYFLGWILKVGIIPTRVGTSL